MANNVFFQPGRMEGQFVPTKNLSVIYQSAGTNASIVNGTLAVLGGFYNEPVYTAAYGSNFADKNTRLATLPGSATVAGVGVIDLAEVPTVSDAAGSITYRMGTATVGLTAAAGTPIRFRKFVLDDTFYTGLDNCTASLTASQFAIVDVSGKWAPSATKPATGLVAQVITTGVALTQGIDPTVLQAFMLIVQLA